MGLVSHEIVLDSLLGVYYAGQCVSGQVLLSLNEPLITKGVFLKLKGLSQVKWSEIVPVRRHNETSRERKTFCSNDTYFKNKLMIFTPQDNNGFIPPGQYCFPFSFTLPVNIPSSFEGEYGCVRYIAKSVIKQSLALNIESMVHISVVSPLDLNALPHLALEAKSYDTASFCCLWCSSGPLSISLLIPSSGFVSGQFVIPVVEVDNASNIHIRQTKLIFMRCARYYAQGKIKAVEKVILEKDLGNVPARKSRTWISECAFQIPALPPSSLQFCRLIDLDYKMKLIASPSGAHLDVIAALPVTIGTIPFRKLFRSFEGTATTDNRPLGWNLIPSAPTQEEVDYYDMPPPSYDSCIFGTPEQDQELPNQSATCVAIDNTSIVSISFAPRYPVYIQHQRV